MAVQPTEAMTRRIVRTLYDRTGGGALEWKMVHTIAKDLNLRDDTATDAAIALGVKNGWLEEAGGPSVCLTDKGRRLHERDAG